MAIKIYTKTGDKGETGLIGGSRVSKDSPRICAYGDVDELNAVLGLCRAENETPKIGGILRGIQKELFVLGADLAAPYEKTATKTRQIEVVRVKRVGEAHVKKLEKLIDGLEAELPPLRNFILPAGSDGACFLHLARTVCRRAERTAVGLSNHEKVNPQVIVYLNRLGDLLFVLARTVNRAENRGHIDESNPFQSP